MNLKALATLACLIVLIGISIPGVLASDLVVYAAIGGIAVLGAFSLAGTKFFKRKRKGNDGGPDQNS